MRRHPEQTRLKKQILLIPVICWMNFTRTQTKSRWCGKLNGKAPGCLFSQKDLVSARLCNPKGSWQQHLLSEREIRDSARWGSSACCDEFNCWWGPTSCWSRTTGVAGVSGVVATWAVWLTVVPQAMGPAPHITRSQQRTLYSNLCQHQFVAVLLSCEKLHWTLISCYSGRF